MEEHVQLKMPKALRVMFVGMLTHCTMYQVQALWERFKGPLSDDLKRRGLSYPHERALREIDDMLRFQNSSCTQVGLPAPDFDLLAVDEELEEQLRLQEHLRKGEKKRKKLNREQLSVVEHVEAALAADKTDPGVKRLFYIQGAGGTGKTYLYKCIIHLMIGRNVSIVVSASTGIAATLLHGGHTVHSAHGIPLTLHEDSVTTLPKQSDRAKALRDAEIIIMDEISQLNKHCLRIIDRALRDLCPHFSNVPFGGKIVLLGGDFKQILPIISDGKRGDVIEASFLRSDRWHLFQTLHLKTNKRTGPNQVEFAKLLHDIGTGKLNNDQSEVVIPNECIVRTEKDLIYAIHGDGVNQDPNVAILATTNRTVDQLNDIVLDRLQPYGDVQALMSVDTSEDDNPETANLLSLDYYHSQTPSGFPLHDLKLKIGAVCLLLRNLNLKEGLCNGTRVQISHIGRRLLQARVLTGISKGQIISIPRIDFRITGQSKSAPFRRRQYPLKLAFAMTINKAQGQTLSQAALHLKDDVFQHGQLYVALSRVSSLNNIKVYCDRAPDPDGNIRIKNIVYPEVIELIGENVS